MQPPDTVCAAVAGWGTQEYVAQRTNPKIDVAAFMNYNSGVSAIYTGYIKTSATGGGTYQFKIKSDDGSKLFVKDMQTPIANLDRQIIGNINCVPEGECESGEGSIALVADYYTEFKAMYYNYFSTAVLKAYWKGPDTGNVWQEIPDTALHTSIFSAWESSNFCFIVA